MKKIGIVLFFVLIFINVLFSSWYPLHNEFYLYTDLARDMLLLEELDEKKIVLLGPRSSTSGLFHGPLWTYVNYPAFVIGEGNPVVVGWYWTGLMIVFLITTFVIVKKLFTETTAYVATLLLSLNLVFEARMLFNPHGAFFLLPSFLFFFIRYLQTRKTWYLIIFFLIAGCIIQFQMAIGIPFLFLAAIPLTVTMIKNKQRKHFFTFFVLLIPLSTFIVFELTHQFLQTKTMFVYAFGDNLDRTTYANYFSIVLDRMQMIATRGIGILKDPYTGYNLWIAIAIVFLLVSQIREKKYRIVYYSFLYFYVGYYCLSIINKSGPMLPHYYLPLFSVVLIIIASFVTSTYKLFVWIGLVLVYYLNFSAAQGYINSFENFTGKDETSWKALLPVAKSVYQGEEHEFGYFIYMPDSLAYQPKYAMDYVTRQATIRSFYFQKKPVTYLIIAPPPKSQPGMKDAWWTKNQVHINKKPAEVKTFPNGYKVEKYLLDEQEIQVPFDPSIDTGIHFR